MRRRWACKNVILDNESLLFIVLITTFIFLPRPSALEHVVFPIWHPPKCLCVCRIEHVGHFTCETDGVFEKLQNRFPVPSSEFTVVLKRPHEEEVSVELTSRPGFGQERQNTTDGAFGQFGMKGFYKHAVKFVHPHCQTPWPAYQYPLNATHNNNSFQLSVLIILPLGRCFFLFFFKRKSITKPPSWCEFKAGYRSAN